MNTYKIIFTRENGTQGTDHFTAINERQARKDFGECYRHSTATIISIELASTNTPATKQQERDTLEKIRKMVEQLGPDSYLATAFEGCFDLAAENIDNDWACSMADRARSAEKHAAELEDKLSEAVKDYEAAHAAAHAVAEEKDAEIARLKDQLKQIQETARWNGQRCDEEATSTGEAQRRAEAAEAEVIQLKAKLYEHLSSGATCSLPPKKRRTHNNDPLQVLFQLSRLPAGHFDRLRALLDRRQVRHRGRGGPHLPRPLHRRVRIVL